VLLRDLHHHRNPQITSFFYPEPLRSHSAHIGQEVEVHYRWHPFHGRRLRAQYSEQRADGRVVHVEIGPGVVTVLPSWMLDAGICAGISLGAARVSADALRDLNRLLLVRGFRRSVSSDLSIVTAEEIQDDRATKEAQDSSINASAERPTEHRVRVDRTPWFNERRAPSG
jgi:hypothetical protein